MFVEDWRESPTYTVAQTARLARTSSASVRRWLYGYQSSGHSMRPVFGARAKDEQDTVEISFLLLAEIVVVSSFRKRGVTLERLRRAREYVSKRQGIAYPFANLRIKTDGLHVLHEFETADNGPTFLVLDEHGQLTLPGSVVEALANFDFEGDLAARWFPLGKVVPIVIDPRLAAGEPTVVDRGVTVSILKARWTHGQTIESLAADYRLSTDVLENVLQRAESLAA